MALGVGRFRVRRQPLSGGDGPHEGFAPEDRAADQIVPRTIGAIAFGYETPVIFPGAGLVPPEMF